MLILSRRLGEQLYIYPDYSKLDPNTTIGELFGSDGRLTITVTQVTGHSVKIGIDAPVEFTVLREELVDLS